MGRPAAYFLFFSSEYQIQQKQLYSYREIALRNISQARLVKTTGLGIGDTSLGIIW